MKCHKCDSTVDLLPCLATGLSYCKECLSQEDDFLFCGGCYGDCPIRNKHNIRMREWGKDVATRKPGFNVYYKTKFHKFIYNDLVFFNKSYSSMSIVDIDRDFEEIPKLYLRLGEIPKDELSKNHRTEELEKGTSAFKIGVLRYQDYEETEPHIAPIFGIMNDSNLMTLSNITSKPLYLISGDIVGTCSDGDPLLKNIKTHETLTLKEKHSSPGIVHYNIQSNIIKG